MFGKLFFLILFSSIEVPKIKKKRIHSVQPDSRLSEHFTRKKIHNYELQNNWHCGAADEHIRKTGLYICHRDDQSLLNILLQNYYQFNSSRFDGFELHLRIANVDRSVVKRYQDGLKQKGQ